VTIPKDSRTRHGLENGDAMLFLETKSGDMVLRPVKAEPEMSLLEHLRQFRGVEIPEIKFHSAPRL
jgi:bifunctional DNA-binding transcriptional regulator/antitoxin component of YhaV-PrlF toxin-antitoxin module